MGVKTEDKKQHFDEIYVADTPVPYKEKILDELSYVSDDFNRREFDRLVMPWALRRQQEQPDKSLNFVDLCACFGNTTMATLYGMDYRSICRNWASAQSCAKIQGKRRLDSTRVTAIDISRPAMEYGTRVGLYDEAVVADLNAMEGDVRERVLKAVREADILISTAALVYLDPTTIEAIAGSFASGSGEGYVLVNFLNPFALEKADATKRTLLKHLEFVGSTATRHRKLSQLERDNYPGEEWALLEIWVLKRRG